MKALSRTLGTVTFTVFCVFVPAIALAIDIPSFDVRATVNPDRSATIVENIAYDFGSEEHHGIYRDVLVAYRDSDGNKHRVNISDISVTGPANEPYTYSFFNQGDAVRIKIGDPDAFVTGVVQYTISYTAHDVVSFFDGYDEFYWNATGLGWAVPIRETRATIVVPGTSEMQTCFIGSSGSTEPCATITPMHEGRNETYFTAGRTLAPGEGLTVALRIRKGLVAAPSMTDTLWSKAVYAAVLVPLIALIVMIRLWLTRGRDPRGRGTIIPEYDAPKGMSVAMMSEVLSGRVSAASISSTIIALAVRGYVKIIREEEKTLGIFTSTGYRFEKVRDADGALSPDEAIVHAALFKNGDSVSSKDTATGTALVSALADVQKDIGERVVSEGLYVSNPSTVIAVYVVVGIAIGIIGAIMGTVLESLVVVISGVAAGIIVVGFGVFMPARTPQGAVVREQILGLKDYLQVAEKNRLDFHNAPEKSPELFEKLLPYAMVLGVSAAWAKEFEGIYTKAPAWYEGGSYPVFTPVVFASDMDAMSSAVSTLATPASSGGGTGGGGFSGGGFGGGGGGSW